MGLPLDEAKRQGKRLKRTIKWGGVLVVTAKQMFGTHPRKAESFLDSTLHIYRRRIVD